MLYLTSSDFKNAEIIGKRNDHCVFWHFILKGTIVKSGMYTGSLASTEMERDVLFIFTHLPLKQFSRKTPFTFQIPSVTRKPINQQEQDKLRLWPTALWLSMCLCCSVVRFMKLSLSDTVAL